MAAFSRCGWPLAARPSGPHDDAGLRAISDAPAKQMERQGGLRSILGQNACPQEGRRWEQLKRLPCSVPELCGCRQSAVLDHATTERLQHSQAADDVEALAEMAVRRERTSAMFQQQHIAVSGAAQHANGASCHQTRRQVEIHRT